MPWNIRIVSSYPPRKCGIGTFSQQLANELENFTGEVGYIRVGAIDKDGLAYNIPVDLVIHQYDPDSWQKATRDIAARANESENPTVVLMQHEYGLDPDVRGDDAQGTNFVQMAKSLRKKGLITLVYLHSVLDDPSEHERAVLQELSAYTDGLLVPTVSAVDILESETYGIERAKIKHIDHGIRMQNPSQYDRLAVKRQYGLENRFLMTTLGLHSPGKGLEYSMRAYGKFLAESCTQSQREKIVYLIGGGCHPEFMQLDGGKAYQEYKASLEQALDESKVKWCRVEQLRKDAMKCCELIMLDAFLDESELLKLYGATNAMVLPYLNMQQISSGILADTVGSGRVAIATKFNYAVELLNPEARGVEGLVIGSHARGILVDAGEPSVEQIAEALDYLVFNQGRRLAMERRAHQRGYQMRWHNTAWSVLQYIKFVQEQQDLVTGRGIGFVREKPSALADNSRLRQWPGADTS